MKIKTILSLALALITGVVFSQDLHVFLHNVEEARFWGEDRYRSDNDTVSSITLTTMINGLQLDKSHLIKVKNIKAVDNGGNQLKELGDPFWGKKPAEYQFNKKLVLRFEAPARNADKIRAVKGTIQYFTPTEENKGRVILPDFLHRKGENLLANSYPEIELIPFGTNGLDIEKEIDRMIDVEVEKRKKKGVIDGEEQKEIDQARKFLKDMMGLNDNRSDYAVVFQLNKDPEIFFSFTIYNGEDKVISNGHSTFRNLYQVHLLEQATKHCYIEIIMENEDAIKELGFELTDIMLP